MRLATLARLGVALVVCTILLSLARPARAAAPTRMERALLAAVNEARAAFHLRRVHLGKRLQAGAHVYARRLMQRNLFTHASLSPGVAETLAWGTAGIMDPRVIVQMWLDSPPHRAILLWPEARRAGFGITIGWFRGYPSIRLAVARFSG